MLLELLSIESWGIRGCKCCVLDADGVAAGLPWSWPFLSPAPQDFACFAYPCQCSGHKFRRESAGVSPADDSADTELETHIVDAPRNAEAMRYSGDMSHTSAPCMWNIVSLFSCKGRAAQEAEWAGDYDGRQHWSLREACPLHL